MRSTGEIDSMSMSLTRALEAVRCLQVQLEAQDGNQILCVIGIGLRFPGGVDDLEIYWKVLAEGRNVVHAMTEEHKAPFAAKRDGLPLRGGFLDDVFSFYAKFFGIGAHETRALDSQHRLLLEVTWEALENAALPPASIKGSITEVFIGLSTLDYLDWYLAAQALHRGEYDVAVAGRVNLILSPCTKLMYQTSSLSPDGLYRAFDARANGTGTSLGDPIEMDALVSPPAWTNGDRLWVGAVKTNFGRVRHRIRARVDAADPVAAAIALDAIATGIPSPGVTLTDGGQTADGEQTGVDPAPANNRSSLLPIGETMLRPTPAFRGPLMTPMTVEAAEYSMRQTSLEGRKYDHTRRSGQSHQTRDARQGRRRCDD